MAPHEEVSELDQSAKGILSSVSRYGRKQRGTPSSTLHHTAGFGYDTTMMTPIHSLDQFVDIDNITLRYRVAGTGAPVVLLHGIGGFLEYWERNVEALAEHNTVYALDMIGFGQSTKPPASYTLEFLAHNVKQFVDALRLERVSLVGLSLGGGVALQFARLYPDSLHKLVLVASAGLGRRISLLLRLMTVPILGELLGRPDPAATQRTYRAIVSNPACIDAAWLDTAYRMGCESGAQRTFLSALRSAATIYGVRAKDYLPIVQALPTIMAPALVVWGKQAPLIPVDYAHVAAEGLPNARLHLFDQCGHLPQLEYADEFNTLVGEFLVGRQHNDSY